MSGSVPAVGDAQSSDPVEQALSVGIPEVMISMFQSMINDTVDAFSDNTSDPDAPF